jgi:hypothetical protein
MGGGLGQRINEPKEWMATKQIWRRFSVSVCPLKICTFSIIAGSDVFPNVHFFLLAMEPQRFEADVKRLGMDTETGTTEKMNSVETSHARPRSNTCPNLHCSSNSRKLKYGSKVIILGTDNVEQRVPQYVGAEATIVDVPGMPLSPLSSFLLSVAHPLPSVHPATWYKVQFSDGAIVTFRPSALKLASECELSSDGTLPSFHFVQPTKHTRVRSSSSSSADGSKNLLSNINPDFWPSCKVKILSGKYSGQTALVKCSGNGWVQLDTPLGEVAKRATELELVEVGKPQPSSQHKPSSASSGGLSITIPSSLTSSNVRRRSNSESVLSPTSFNTLVNSRHIDGSTFQHSHRPLKEKETRTVLVDPKVRNAQSDYFRKYVEKEVAKAKKRPDLKYWNRQIQSNMFSEEHEREVARDIRDNFCHFCNVEKWPGSIVCWNELCSASPIYWQHPGAAGSPEVPETRYRQQERVFAQGTEKRRHSLDQDYEPTGKRFKSQFAQQASEDERIACEILGSLSSLTPGECFPNLVTEYLNTSPVLQIPSTSSPAPSTPSPVVSSNSSSSASSVTAAIVSPVKSQKNERSDSGATDSEDLIRSDPLVRQQPLILKFKGNKDSHPPLLLTVPETKPLQVNQPTAVVESPSRPGSSPNSQQLKLKRAKGPFSPTQKGGMFLTQGTPPSQEEFARLVTEHHFSVSSQIPPPSPPVPPQATPSQENTTPPLSALTARVDRGPSAAGDPNKSDPDLFPGRDVAHGPPLLRSSHNSLDPMFPP